MTMGRQSLVGPGPSRMADLLSAAGSSCSSDHQQPEFGWIRTPDLLLEADSMPGVLIPAHEVQAGGYRLVPLLLGTGTPVAIDDLPAPAARLAEGDRVFVVWSNGTPIIQQRRGPEFGWMRAGLLLEPDSMPGVLISAYPTDPAGYRVLQVLVASSISTTPTAVSTFGTHTHQLPLVGLSVGDRVFVAWNATVPVVVGRL